MEKRGQQEIVGFVLIVVLVVIGLMVFLVIALRGGGKDLESVRVSNMLDVIMKSSSDCAIVYEPDYDDFEDLFKSCFKGKRCSNLGVDACDYLNKSLNDVVESMISSEAGVSGWGIDFLESNDGGEVGIWRMGRWNNCSGRVSGAQRVIVSGGGNLVIRMKICEIA